MNRCIFISKTKPFWLWQSVAYSSKLMSERIKSSPMIPKRGGNICSSTGIVESVTDSVCMKLLLSLIRQSFAKFLVIENHPFVIFFRNFRNMKIKNLTYCCSWLFSGSLIGSMYSLATMQPFNSLGADMEFSISVDVVFLAIDLPPLCRLWISRFFSSRGNWSTVNRARLSVFSSPWSDKFRLRLTFKIASVGIDDEEVPTPFPVINDDVAKRRTRGGGIS